MTTNRRIEFINQLKALVTEQNGTLNQEAKEKENAHNIVWQLAENINSHFKRLSSLKHISDELEQFEYAKKERLILNPEVAIIVEVENQVKISELIVEGINSSDSSKSLYLNLLELLQGHTTIKHHLDIDQASLDKKIRKQLAELLDMCDKPTDYLEYSDGNSSKDNSPGFNSEKYLEVILSNPRKKYIFIDQPEDNLGNKFISKKLVAMLRDLKFKKQIFLVTHNPSIVVYGDAESIILASNTSNRISYKQIVLEDQNAQKEVCGVLDGGQYIFNNRARKYNIKRILKGDRESVKS